MGMRGSFQILLFLALGFLISLGIWTQTRSLEEGSVVAASTSSPNGSSSSMNQQKMTLQTSQSSPVRGARSQSSSRLAEKKTWDDFIKTYGPDFIPEYAPSGRLISIRGNLGSNQNKGSPDFRTQDGAMAISRAREIVEGVGDLLGVRPDWPLKNAVANGSPISAQVFLTQTYEGVPLAPVGGIKVDLGTHGELLGLYSDYASDVTVKNRSVLTVEEARQKIGLQASTAPDQKIVWVTGSDGFFAYQFMVHGRQVVVDAESGQILLNRDRRQY
jgi:hypothetical protein